MKLIKQEVQDSEPCRELLWATGDSGRHLWDLCFLFRVKWPTVSGFPRFLYLYHSTTKFIIRSLMYLIPDPEFRVVTSTQEWEHVLLVSGNQDGFPPRAPFFLVGMLCCVWCPWERRGMGCMGVPALEQVPILPSFTLTVVPRASRRIWGGHAVGHPLNENAQGEAGWVQAWTSETKVIIMLSDPVLGGRGLPVGLL